MMKEDRRQTGLLTSPRGVTWLGLATNVALSAVKLVVGALFLSQTLIADGLHSASDLITDVAVLAGLRVSKKPADETHHYGHRRVSTLVGAFVGAVLLVAAVWIAFSAVRTLRHPRDRVLGMLPFAVAAASIPLKEALFWITRYVGRRAGNISLLANAWHHRTDAFTSVAAAAGLAGAALGGTNWAFLDPLTAIVLAAFLVVVSVRIIGEGASELIDRAPSPATLEGIEQAVAQTRGVRGYHAFRARKVGGKVEMDIHVQVDPNLTVREGHDVATAVRQKVVQADPNVVEVIVHIEPTEGPPRDRRV